MIPRVIDSAGQTPPAGFAIENPVGILGRPTLLPLQPGQQTGIDISAARAHQQPFIGRKAHGGIDWFAVAENYRR